ncbi:Aspartic proteinase-like protein 1 [Sesamum angolense]|uniref:Aspartic proteinase-like protein 1 n=1 Tax=Sesamum angolense TaxID=2727404 RepID=A0AAE1WB67_9LAMI|nr:Aspartic proteinase-like protein 1 [Sesamum angolense]
MGKTNLFGVILVLFLVFGDGCGAKPMYSWRLIHRFSDEARSLWVSRGESGGGNKTTSWPEKKSFGHMRMLLGNDLKRQRLRLGAQNQLLVTSQGGRTINYGNGFSHPPITCSLIWLHYTWIDIGTPNNSFLVALDTGSDMFWVPCDCIECAPLSLSYYNMLEKELGEYSPSHSSSSKHIPCSHELCEIGPNCDTPKAHCPYTVNYLSMIHQAQDFFLRICCIWPQLEEINSKTPYRLPCGSKQTGQYLDGIAPDGVMGLGPRDISVPSLLAKSGLIPHSFSFCYDKSYSGRLYFGDQGPSSQKSTSLLQLKGNSLAYIVEVETYCVGSFCLNQTGYKAQVDTGSSFTYLPSWLMLQGSPYRDSKTVIKARALKVPNIPSMKLVFSMNQSLVIENPMFHIADDQGGLYCLGIQRIDGDIGLIGQNFFMGYRIVFDWENLKLGWSNSNCQDIASDDEIHSKPPPSDASPNPLPTNEQQQNPHGHAVPPAVAGKAPPKPSAAYRRLSPYRIEGLGFIF